MQSRIELFGIGLYLLVQGFNESRGRLTWRRKFGVFTSAVEQHLKSKTVSGELLTEQQLAEQWHTTPRHIRRLRVESELPYIKLGRFVRFDQADVALWLAEHKSGTVVVSRTRRLATSA